MTENEAIRELEDYFAEEHKQTISFVAITLARKAIKEIQQYRAIGTVEELKSMKENGAFTGVELAQLAAMQMRLKEYSAIGTIEELQKAMKYASLAKKHGTVGKAIDSCAEYETIGTIEEFKALKEKNTKKRFNIFESHGIRQFVCGCCDRPILTTDNYCSFCGQKLDWK